jgi:hypothetical protein
MNASTAKRIPRSRTSLKRGPVCTICRHQHRVLIESTRLAGASLDNVAKKYACSRDALHRHMTNHVDDEIKAERLAGIPLKELAELATSEGLTVLQYLSVIRSTLMNEFTLCAAVHDRNGTAILAGRLNETLRTIGQLSGELGSMATSLTINSSISIMNSPVFIDLQQMLVKRLRDHPQAMASVMDGLAELERRSAPSPIAGPVIEHEGAHAAA